MEGERGTVSGSGVIRAGLSGSGVIKAGLSGCSLGRMSCGRGRETIKDFTLSAVGVVMESSDTCIMLISGECWCVEDGGE